MLDRLEILLEQREQLRVGAACEHLGEELPAGRQRLDREVGGGFDQPHGAQMIGLLVAHRVGRHVRHDQIGRAAKVLLAKNSAIT